jgi:hypothetical protein
MSRSQRDGFRAALEKRLKEYSLSGNAASQLAGENLSLYVKISRSISLSIPSFSLCNTLLSQQLLEQRIEYDRYRGSFQSLLISSNGLVIESRQNQTRAEVYMLDAWIRQISPTIWRRLLVHSDSVPSVKYQLIITVRMCRP